MSEVKYHMSSNVIHLYDLYINDIKSDNKKHFLLKLQYNIVLKKLSSGNSMKFCYTVNYYAYVDDDFDDI